MKVKKINASSRKTDIAIKKAFAELLEEKKELNKITVTELVKKADITRGSFYTHYDDIYDIANEYQDETLELLNDYDNNLKTIDDIFNFFDKTINVLKENEKIYKKILTSDEPLVFVEKLKRILVNKIYNCLVINNYKDDFLKLKVNIFVDGITIQILRYFRETNYYTFEEMNRTAKDLFKKIFIF